MFSSYTGESKSASALVFQFGSEEESPDCPHLVCFGLHWRMALE